MLELSKISKWYEQLLMASMFWHMNHMNIYIYIYIYISLYRYDTWSSAFRYRTAKRIPEPSCLRRSPSGQRAWWGEDGGESREATKPKKPDPEELLSLCRTAWQIETSNVTLGSLVEAKKEHKRKGWSCGSGELDLGTHTPNFIDLSGYIYLLICICTAWRKKHDGKEAGVSSNWHATLCLVPCAVLPRHQWCGQDHAINCARAALRNSDASVQEVDCLLGLLSSELLTPGTNVSKQRGIPPQQDSYTNTVHIDISS